MPAEVSPYDAINTASLRDALLYVTHGSLPDDDGYGFMRVGAAIKAAKVDGGAGLWRMWLDANLPGNLVDVPQVWAWLGSAESVGVIGEVGTDYVVDSALAAGWDGAHTPFSTLPPVELPAADDDGDGLPHALPLASVWYDPPCRPPVLIGTEDRGLLRRGHVAVVSAPSKAGKSWAMIELGVAVATGTTWFGFPCAQGRVLYVNMEIDGRSCIQRVLSVAKAVDPSEGFGRMVADNTHVLNLRGTAASTDQYRDHVIPARAAGAAAMVAIAFLRLMVDIAVSSRDVLLDRRCRR